MIVFLLAMVSAPQLQSDWCSWREPAEHHRRGVRVGSYGRNLEFTRPYFATWAACLKLKGAPPPQMRVVYIPSGGKRTVVEKTIEMRPNTWPGRVANVSERSPLCPPPPGKRYKSALLRGPAGRERWVYPVRVRFELIGKGPYAAMSLSEEVEVMCSACANEGHASISYYRPTGRGPRTQKVRFAMGIDKELLECAAGGGAWHLRYFWIDRDKDEFWPLRPDRIEANVQRRLKAENKTMRYEKLTPAASLCRSGKTLIWELVGVGTFAHHTNSGSYGPSRFIRRDDIEFLRCK